MTAEPVAQRHSWLGDYSTGLKRWTKSAGCPPRLVPCGTEMPDGEHSEITSTNG